MRIRFMAYGTFFTMNRFTLLMVLWVLWLCAD